MFYVRLVFMYISANVVFYAYYKYKLCRLLVYTLAARVDRYSLFYNFNSFTLTAVTDARILGDDVENRFNI